MRYNAAEFLRALFAPQAAAKPARRGPDLPEEWLAVFEERAAIMQFDGRQTREQAEHNALLDVRRQMRRAAAGPGDADRVPASAAGRWLLALGAGQ